MNQKNTKQVTTPN